MTNFRSILFSVINYALIAVTIVLAIMGLLYMNLFLSTNINYKVFYLPNMDMYACVRLVESGYDHPTHFLDVTFADKPEEAIAADPWHSDMIRVGLHPLTQLVVATKSNDRDTIYVKHYSWIETIEKQGNKKYILLDPLDEHRIDDQSSLRWKSAENHNAYMISCYPRPYKRKRIHLQSLSEGEAVKEIKQKTHVSLRQVYR